jgi:hypothetical protein
MSAACPRLPIVGGLTTMMALATLVLAGLPTPARTWLLPVLLIPISITGPLAMQPTTAVLLDSVPAHQSGLASGQFNTSRARRSLRRASSSSSTSWTMGLPGSQSMVTVKRTGMSSRLLPSW